MSVFAIMSATMHQHDFVQATNATQVASVRQIMSLKPESLHSDKKCHYFPIQARDEFFGGKWNELYRHPSTKAFMEHRHPIYSYSPCITKHNLGILPVKQTALKVCIQSDCQ